MTVAIVQSAFARGNTTQTLTLGAVPTAGNWLVFTQLGRNLTLTAPISLAQIEADIGASASNQGSALWYRQVTVSDVAPAHRYWRLSLIATASGTNIAMAEAQFRSTAGTAQAFGAGTASASSSFDAVVDPPSNVADNNVATWWASSTNSNAWWQWDYGSGISQSIAQITITARNDSFYNQAPTSFALQFSDDGAAWTTVQSFVSTTWTQGQTQTFSVAAPGMSWAFSGITDWTNLAVFELSGVNSIAQAHGAASVSTTTVTTGALGAGLDSDGIRLLGLEWDGIQTATTPSGWTLLSPSTWQGTNGGTTGNHDAAVWQIPVGSAGGQAITTSAAVAFPIWLDLQINTTTVPLRVTQAGAETWGSNTAAPLRVTQAGAEAWGSSIAAPLHATQAGAEAWVDMVAVVSPTSGSLIFNGTIPSSNVSSAPSAGSLNFTGFIPRSDLSSTPSAGSLNFIGGTPLSYINSSPISGSLIFNGFTPRSDTSSMPSSGSMIFTGLSAEPIQVVNNAIVLVLT